MGSVEFVPLNLRSPTLEGETLLDAARRVHAPVGNACGGTGVCGRCRVRIVAGREHLTPATELELRLGLAEDERLACQAIARGDCLVTTSYW